MWKPIVFLASLMVVIGLATCTVHRTVINTSLDGMPLDHWGHMMTCPLCRKGRAFWLEREYEYRCEECGKKFRARKKIETWDTERNTWEAEVNW